MTRIFLNLLLLVIFSLFAFSHNPGRLFIGNDGPMVLSLAREQLLFHGISPNLHSNFLQGVGNLSFPANLSFMPGFWLPFMTADGQFFPAAIYTWFACMMFVTVLLVGWNYRLPRGTTYAAAWLLTILMFPYMGNYFAIYAVTASSPLFVWYMFAAAVGDIGVQRMGAGNWRQMVFYALVLLLGIFLMIAASPAATILIAPMLAVSFTIACWRAPRHVRQKKLLGAVLVLALCAALGWVEYVLGLLLYSSSGFFMHELADSYAPSAEFASILFQGHIIDRAFGPVLFILGGAGAGMALYKKNEALRIPACITLAGQVLHAVIGAGLLTLSGGWTGPPPIYSEMMFFALYAWFAMYLLATFIGAHATRLRIVGAPVFVGILSIVLLTQPAVRERHMLQSYAMPPASSPLIQLLNKETAALPDAAFSGRVASVLPGGLKSQVRYAYQMNVAARNDYQTTGLWLYNIPTLHEYNQTITPAFYRLVRDFLTLPNDRQNRSLTNFSYIDTRILAMLGVRFLLTFDAQRDGLIHRGTLELPGIRPLSVLELPEANTRGIAAARILHASSVQEASKIMHEKDFSLSDAILFEPLPETTFVPVQKSSITLEQGNYRIRAESTGNSLLIVPVEYSRCLTITPLSGKKPRTVRVNIALTGLVFEHNMDILLAAHVGPFLHPRCRLQDYTDFKHIMGK